MQRRDGRTLSGVVSLRIMFTMSSVANLGKD